MKLQELQKAIHRTSSEKGWTQRFFRAMLESEDSAREHVVTKLMLIVTELAEGVEELRAGRGLDEVYYQNDGKPEGLPIELADAVIRALDLAELRGINMAEAISLKMAYNETRPSMHGGKKL